MLDSNIIIVLIVIIVVNTFFIGYFFGRFTNQNGVSNDKTKSFFKQQESKTQEVNTISIDDKKFVVDITTEGLEKKYNSLGDVKTTEENISNSVNKLKNLKR